MIIKASVAFFHKKKKMMPTCRDNTIPLEYAMMTYRIKKKMVVNLGAIIRNSILSWKEHINILHLPLFQVTITYVIYYPLDTFQILCHHINIVHLST